MSSQLPDGQCIVFVVKYWKTQGIFRLRGTVNATGYFNQAPNQDRVHHFLNPREFTRSSDDARALVEKRRQAAIRSLQKQLTTLEALDPKKMVIPLLKGDKGAKADAR